MVKIDQYKCCRKWDLESRIFILTSVFRLAIVNSRSHERISRNSREVSSEPIFGNIEEKALDKDEAMVYKF